MSYLNKALLMGNLTRDPELRRTQSGQSICEFSIAINRKNRSSDGQEHEETCFVDIAVWGKAGEACKQYLAKGRSVFVDGRLTLDQWQTENGERKSRLRVVAEKVSFIGSAKNHDAAPPNGVSADYAPEIS